MHKRKIFKGHDPVKGVSLFQTVCGKTVTGADITPDSEEVTCPLCLSQDRDELNRQVIATQRSYYRLTEKLILVRVRIKELERAAR